MGERSNTEKFDFEALRRAIERGDPEAMLEFYADDAGVRVLHGGAPVFEVAGKAEVAKYLRAVHERPARHRVVDQIFSNGRIHFKEASECQDGARTMVATTLELREGEILRQTDVVVGRENGGVGM